MENRQPRYDYQQRSKATNSFILRILVAGYILYLAWQIVTDTSDTTMPPWAAWLIGGALAAAALAFGYYSWRRYCIDRKAAELPPEEEPEESEEAPEELEEAPEEDSEACAPEE